MSLKRGRGVPCPCGSGRKFKHGQPIRVARTRPSSSTQPIAWSARGRAKKALAARHP
ncbi:MAG: hypothetical protein E6K47_10650 [Gammaproteobacteria bacterium]|nr:MAG: hypothetical protein E6K47_10650 [Gammaproteobacteria bacterium]